MARSIDIEQVNYDLPLDANGKPDWNIPTYILLVVLVDLENTVWLLVWWMGQKH